MTGTPPDKVYSPATLAREWQCSPRTVRNLIDKRELRAFRLGGKLLRIPGEAVEEFLERNSTWAVYRLPHK